MRVKTILDYYPDDLEKSINKFLEKNPNLKVIDIKIAGYKDNMLVALIQYLAPYK